MGEFLGFLSGSLDRYGVEINPEAHDFLRRTHPEIHFSAVGIESDDFLFKDLKFDVIILSHVFEHIAKPKEFVLKLSYLLDKKGIILMDIPNSQSFGFTKTQKFWFHLDVPRHLFFYSRKTLEPFLKEYGLNVCYFGASALDYFQDLAVSFYMKNKNTATILNVLVLIVFFPIFIFIRSIVALCAPQYAEINTYVIEKLGILKK